VECVHLVLAKHFSFVVTPTSLTGTGVVASPPVGSDPMTQNCLSILATSLLEAKYNQPQPFPGSQKFVRLLHTVMDSQRASHQSSPQPKITDIWLVQAGDFFFLIPVGSLFLCFGLNFVLFLSLESKWSN
jgi:hypothetical protein